MKNWILVLVFILGACAHPSEDNAGAGKDGGAAEIKPVEARCAELKKRIGTSTEKNRTEFFAEVLVAIESQGTQCTPKEAAAYLDAIYEIHCDELCLVKEK